MYGLSWLLFSFKGIIHRAEFLLGILVVIPIFLFFFGWFADYMYSKFLVDLLANHKTLAQNYITESQIEEKLSLQSIQTDFVLKYFPVSNLPPVLLTALFAFWAILAVYIKRFRDMGVHWMFTLVIMMLLPIAFIIAKYEAPEYVDSQKILDVVKTHKFSVYSLYLIIPPIIYILVPTFWPTHEEDF